MKGLIIFLSILSIVFGVFLIAKIISRQKDKTAFVFVVTVIFGVLSLVMKSDVVRDLSIYFAVMLPAYYLSKTKFFGKELFKE